MASVMKLFQGEDRLVGARLVRGWCLSLSYMK